MSEVTRWRRPFGGGIPPEMLIRNLDIIRQFVEKNVLKPLEQTAEGAALGMPGAAAGPAGKAVLPQAAPMEERTPSFAEMVRPSDIFGGIQIDHLHFDGRIYLLTTEQWQQFTKQMLRAYSERLARVQNVTFGGLVALSEAVDTL